MKSIINIFFLLLNSIYIANSQHDYTKEYYPFVNQAEVKIIENRYDEAVELYLKAFKSVPQGFSKDYYNAAVCSIYAMKYDTVFEFLDTLVVKGTEKSFFKNCSVFEPIRKKLEWQLFLTRFDKNHQIALNRQNSTLEKILKGIEFSDQEFRAKSGSYQLYRDTINKIDKHNVKIMNHLIEKYGFPNEHLIGRKNPLEEEIPSFIIFFHQSQKMSKNKEDFDFTDIQIEAVKKGELNPHFLAEWMAFQAKSGNSLGDATITQLSFQSRKSPFLTLKYTQEQKKLMNTKRLELGLEPLEEFSRKALFARKNEEKAKCFAFKRYSMLYIFDFNDEKVFKDAFNKFEHIE